MTLQTEPKPTPPAATRRRKRRVNLDWLYPAALIGALLVGWYLWVNVWNAPQYLWPSMGDVSDLLIHSGDLRTAAVNTTQLIVMGFVIAVLFGLTIATLTASSRFFETGIFPILLATQFVPLVALAPLFIIWWGFETTPKLIIIVMFGYFPIVITTLGGLRSVEIEKTYLARSMGAGRSSLFTRIRFPQALPSLFAGLKICFTSCVIGAVVAEFIVGSSGIGYRILQAQGVGDSATLVAGVVYLALDRRNRLRAPRVSRSGSASRGTQASVSPRCARWPSGARALDRSAARACAPRGATSRPISSIALHVLLVAHPVEAQDPLVDAHLVELLGPLDEELGRADGDVRRASRPGSRCRTSGP